MVQRKDLLTYSERTAMSREDWAANHRRDDATKLVKPPPSLEGFFPDKPPPPRLVSSNDGKQAPHNAHAPLTQSLGDKLRDLPIGAVVKVNPPVIGTPANERELPVADKSSDALEPPSRRPARQINEIVPGYVRVKRKPTRTQLDPNGRREALIWGYAYGAREAAERFDVTSSVIGQWMRMLEDALTSPTLPEIAVDGRALRITGVNTPGRSRESIQAIFDEGMRLREMPLEPVAPVKATPPTPEPEPEPHKSALAPVPQSEADKLREQLSEREATLSGYKIALDNLRMELATTQAELRTVREHNGALVKTLEAMARR